MADILVQKDANNLIPKLGITAGERAAWAVDYTIYDINADGTKGAAYGPTSPPPADETLAPDTTAQFRRDDAAALQSLVSGAGISAPSALFANLPAAADNLGNVIRVTDIGKGGTLWMPSGDIWAPVNGRAQLLRTPVPFILSSSGSIGNNGALTLSVALDRVYARSFMYFPANAIFSGSAAGWYWTVMSSTTAGTIYNNVYTSGYPAIPTIAGFTTTGPGAFTQTAGVDLTCLSVNLPGGCLYRYGGMQSRLSMTSGGAGGVKTGKVFAGTSQFHVTTIAAANNFANALGGFAMDGSTNTLKTTHAEQTAGVSNGVTYAQIIFTNDMTVDKAVTVTLKHAAAATDWVVLQEAEIEVLGG